MDPRSSSFGVELEFIIAHIPESEFDASSHGKVIEIPPYIEAYEADMYVYRHVQATLDIMAPMENTRVFTTGGRTRPEIMYQSWQAKADYSLDFLTGDREIPGRYDGVDWVGIEVTSPALWNNQESLDEVRRVVDLIKRTYRVVTSEACGLHFHVGQGPNHLPLGDLRRAAAFFFAADPLLAQLHPAHRLDNDACLSVRLFTRVAQGSTAEEARRELDSARPGGVAHEGADSGLQDIASLAPPDTGAPAAFHRLVPHGQLQGYPVEPGQAPVLPGSFVSHFVVPRGALEGVRELLSASRPEVLAVLLEVGIMPSFRPAYNFSNYNLYKFGDPDMKRTIEFRQPAATLDADEIIAFAKTFIGLYEFAVNASFEQLWSVILRCAQADSPPEQTGFDVFDLLASIGLVDETQFLQQMLIRRQSTWN